MDGTGWSDSGVMGGLLGLRSGAALTRESPLSRRPQPRIAGGPPALDQARRFEGILADRCGVHDTHRVSSRHLHSADTAAADSIQQRLLPASGPPCLHPSSAMRIFVETILERGSYGVRLRAAAQDTAS